MTRLNCIFFLIISSFALAQSPYPQDYFRNPLDITLVLSGTFAELRSNHFHSGMDIKTKGREGLNVYASADGYVSRIKISHYGYGKAVYITHPNGYTTVYAHLQQLAPKLDAYIKEIQYNKESFEIEVFPKPDELPVTKGEKIALSGNTGGSGGPHLHFEIRDNEERPLNPMLFGLKAKDTRKPNIYNLYAYPLNDSSHVNGFNTKQKLRLIPLKNGNYKAEEIKAYGEIGFGVETTDRQDYAGNKNGVYNIKTFFNGSQNFEIDFKRFSFYETKHINRLIDYSHYRTNRKRIQKLYKENYNPLSLYHNVIDDGKIKILKNEDSVYKIDVSDFDENITSILLNITSNDTLPIIPKEKQVTDYFIKASEPNELNGGNIAVTIPKYTFYDDFYMDFEVKNDTLHLHEANLPLQKNMTITFDISKYKDKDANGLYIARLVGWNDYPIYSSTKRIGDVLYTETKNLGKYTLAIDSGNPTIKPINFSNGKWLSKYRFLKLKINDKQTGIKSYRATVNGKFILMEYDYKTKTLTHDFNDNIVTDVKNNLKVIVTDNVGNSSTFEATFFRK